MNKNATNILKVQKNINPSASETETSSIDIGQKVFEIIEDLCLIPVHDDNQTLLKDLSFDSLRMVMLLVTLEDSFEIELDESDMNPFALITVRDVVDLVVKYISPQEEESTHA